MGHEDTKQTGRGGTPRIVAVEGPALPLPGDDIDTDRIIPARYLRAVSFEGLERHLFEDDRSAALAAHPFDDPRFAGARVLLVHRNFGCGSSREHAPQALYRRGIRAIVGESFSDIFFGNAAMLGLPCVTAARADVDALMALAAGDPPLRVRVDLEALECACGGRALAIRMPEHTRVAFVTGSWDTTAMLLDRDDDVRRVAARLPYLDRFTTARGA